MNSGKVTQAVHPGIYTPPAYTINQKGKNSFFKYLAINKDGPLDGITLVE